MINQEPAISPFKELVAIHKELENLRLRIEKAGPFNSSKKNHIQLAREIHSTSIPAHVKKFYEFMSDKKMREMTHDLLKGCNNKATSNKKPVYVPAKNPFIEYINLYLEVKREAAIISEWAKEIKLVFDDNMVLSTTIDA